MAGLPTAAELDAADPLASFRGRFVFAEDDLVYLDGNSLGRLPQAATARAREVVEREWGHRLIRSWNDAWWETPQRIGDQIAGLVGAEPGEVVIADSTSVNFFKLVVAALRLQEGRNRIVTDAMNFPSDIYVLQGAAALLGARHHIDVVPSADGVHGPAEAIVETLDEDVAFVTLSHVGYQSGYRYDLATITAAAHAAGALVIWDLSHSVGAVPIDLGAANADLAVGCTYKYLNGGPGAPAFLFVRRDLQGELANPLTGWWGHSNPFEFDLDYRADGEIRKFLTGTAPMLSLSMIETGVALTLEAGIERIAAKSHSQSDYLIRRWRAELAPLGFTLNSPTDSANRGSHLSLGHPDALGIDLALINDYGVLPDFRPPDNLRFGIAPLYNSYQDLATAVDALAEIVGTGRHVAYADQRPKVT